MDEMTLLQEFRADLPEPSDLARQRARRALLDPPRRSPRPVLRHGVLVTAAAAVVGAVAVGAAVLDLPDGGTPPARPVTALVRFDQPTFPLRLTAVPVGLSGPRYSLEDKRHLAVYLDESGHERGDVTVAISGAPALAPASRATTIEGTPAVLRVVDQHNGGARFRSLSLEWERRPGQWVIVTGTQGRAEENVVRAVAANLADAPQPIGLQLRVAPAGWVLTSYKDDRILMFEDLNSEAERKPRLVVFREDAFDPRRPEKLMDPGPTTSTDVDGRRALVVRGRETAEVQVELPNGSAAVLYGPSDLLTGEQLLRMAAEVSLTSN